MARLKYYNAETGQWEYADSARVNSFGTVDSELSETSTNPVQNRVVTQKIGELSDEIDELKENGTNTGTADASKFRY